MKFRSYKEEDNVALGRIYDSCRPDEFYNEPGDFKVVKWLDESFIQENIVHSKIIVCEIDSLVVGFCGWRNNHIYWLFVNPTYRRLGIAKKLLGEALCDMSGEISLSVWTSNARAQALYSEYGFSLGTRKTVDYYGKHLELDTMVLKRENA